MSHKAGHIIIHILMQSPDITPQQHERLEEIEARDEYTLRDRLYLSWLTWMFTA